MVREATGEDFPLVMELAIEAHNKGTCEAAELDKSKLARTLVELMQSPYGVVLVNGDGVLAGQVMQPYFSSQKFGHELLWYSRGKSLDLKAAFEKWSEDMGLDGVFFAQWAFDDRSDEIFEKRLKKQGYIPLERSYTKRFV